MQRKRFCSGTGQNSMKLGLDREVEFKKSLKFYCQILLRVLAKVALNFVHFAWQGQKWVKYSKYLLNFSRQFCQI